MGAFQRPESSRRLTARLVSVSLAAVVPLVGACSDDSTSARSPSAGTSDTSDSVADADSADSSTTSPPAGGEAVLVAESFAFSSVEVGPGEEVTFRNDDGAAHTATADDGSFDTGSVPSGGSATFTAPSTAGTYAFHCDIHPSMTATLTVEA